MRQAWGHLAPLVVVLGAALWACGLSVAGTAPADPVTGDETAADGSSDVSPDGSPDVSPVSPDAWKDAPSPSDGSSNDVADVFVADAGSDAQDAAHDSPTTFCTTVSPPATFCADFDNPADANPSAGWDTANVDAGSTATLSTTTYASSPRSLHATSGQGGESSVEKAFSMNHQISVEFDVDFAAIAATGDLGTLMLSPGASGTTVFYYASSGDSYFQEGGNEFSTSASSPTLHIWHHVAVTVASDGATTTITASADGNALWNNHTLSNVWPAPTTVTLNVGAAAMWQMSSAEVFIDNVVVRVQ